MKQAWSSETDELDLATLYPALARYCPLVHDLSPQQALFLLLDCREAFYGGAAGGGKTVALLAAALQYVDVPGYAALLLRRTFPQLSQPGQLIPLSKEWLGPTDAVWNEQQKEWRFPSGAVLKFGHVKDEQAVFNYQGGAYHFVGWDELTQFTPTQFEYVSFSRQRRDTTMQQRGVPIRVRASANPGGVGHAWVKRRYIDGRDASIAFVPAKVRDNPGLDADDYEQSMAHLGETLRRQLMDGDWGAFEGAAFEITPDHLIEDFTLEDAHERFEAADWGFNGAPWALWAVDHEGNVIGYDMLYVRDTLPSDFCPDLIEKRKQGWGLENHAFVDPSIWHRTGGKNRWGEPAKLADEFSDNGVPVIRANNDPRAGLTRIREMLKLDPEHPFPDWHPKRGEKGAPRVFFVRPRMGELLEELEAAPLQPIDKRDAGEIVDPEWESQYGHAVAMTRYALMTRPAPSPRPYVPLDDDRAEWLRKYGDQVEKPKRTPRDYQL